MSSDVLIKKKTSRARALPVLPPVSKIDADSKRIKQPLMRVVLDFCVCVFKPDLS